MKRPTNYMWYYPGGRRIKIQEMTDFQIIEAFNDITTGASHITDPYVGVRLVKWKEAFNDEIKYRHLVKSVETDNYEIF